MRVSRRWTAMEEDPVDFSWKGGGRIYNEEEGCNLEVNNG